MFKKFVTVCLTATLIAGCSLTGISIEQAGSTVRLDVIGGLGTGVHLSDGRILTAAHVVGDNTEVLVTKQNGGKVKAKVLWVDKASDLAMIQILVFIDLKEKEVDCSIPPVGSAIQSNGNPFGIDFLKFFGHVAGTPRPMGPWALVTPVDVSINQGMSGGPTYNEDGKIIGINVGLRSASKDTIAPSGISFIVPGNKICEIMEQHGN